MALCECGCGGEAKPGRRFISGHNVPIKKGTKLSEETKRKGRETRKINKEIKEGKRLPPELPFCACGCGGRVTKIGNKYIHGHQSRGIPKTDIHKKHLSESHSGKKLSEEHKENIRKATTGVNNPFFGHEHTEEVKEHLREINLGKVLTEDHKKNISDGLNSFYETEEGDKLRKQITERCKGKPSPMEGKYHTEISKQKMSDTHKGENNSMYGVSLPAWNKGETKETNESVKKYGEKCSITKKVFFQTEEGKKLAKEMSKAKKEYYQTDEGLKHRQFLRETIIENLKKGVYNRKPTQPEKGIDSIVQLLFPKEYGYNGNFELGISIGGKIPDFVNVNGKKKAIDMFGDYWHDGEDPQIRIDLFKEYGWDLLVIWEHELKDRDAVIQKILKFHGVESDYVVAQKTLEKWIDSKDNIIKGGDKN